MAIHILPKTTLTRDQVKDWSRYKPMLARSPTVQRYLEPRLKGWVTNERIDNPLQISWVRILLDHGLIGLEQFFREFEAAMGKENLCRLVEDTLPATAPVYAIERAIASLWGEILAFRELRKTGKAISKITERGDWLVDETVVSVKTILDMAHNYRLLENTIEGLIYLGEFKILQQCESIRFSKTTGMDDSFLKKVVDFLNSSLKDLLNALFEGFQEPEWTNISLEGSRVCTKAGFTTGFLAFRAIRYNGGKINIRLNEHRSGEQEKDGHALTIDIERRSDGELAFSVTSDMDTWWGWPEVDQERLGKQIRERIKKLEHNWRQGDAPFVGWVNIEAHPSLQQGIDRDRKRLGEFLKTAVGDVPFGVVFYVHGGFELADKPVIVCVGPRDYMPVACQSGS